MQDPTSLNRNRTWNSLTRYISIYPWVLMPKLEPKIGQDQNISTNLLFIKHLQLWTDSSGPLRFWKQAQSLVLKMQQIGDHFWSSIWFSNKQHYLSQFWKCNEWKFLFLFECLLLQVQVIFRLVQVVPAAGCSKIGGVKSYLFTTIVINHRGCYPKTLLSNLTNSRRNK